MENIQKGSKYNQSILGNKERMAMNISTYASLKKKNLGHSLKMNPKINRLIVHIHDSNLFIEAGDDEYAYVSGEGLWHEEPTFFIKKNTVYLQASSPRMLSDKSTKVSSTIFLTIPEHLSVEVSMVGGQLALADLKGSINLSISQGAKIDGMISSTNIIHTYSK